jgi:mono/diheme cytochrome c family protein
LALATWPLPLSKCQRNPALRAVGVPAPDLTDKEWKRGSTDGEIVSVIKSGVPPDLAMEPWGDRIKDPDIWSALNYMRSLAKK